MDRNEQVQQMLDKAEQGIKDVFESDKYKNYLDTMAKFYKYSYRNCLLIAMQQPEATYVAGYKAWITNFNRQVRKGEKGIQILGYAPKNIQVEQIQRDINGNEVIGNNGLPKTETVTKKIPSYVPVYVYDISQTDGEPLPVLINELDGSVESYAELFQAIKDVAAFQIVFEDIQGEAKGYCDPAQKKIAIQEGMSEKQTVKTAIHEVTHADLHTPQTTLTVSERTDRATREIEAESVSYVVCSHYGIDTSEYSFGYITGWSSTKELAELKKSLDNIKTQAADLIDRIDNRLIDREKEKELSERLQSKAGKIREYMEDRRYLHGDLSVPYKVLNEMEEYVWNLPKEKISEMTFDERMFYILQFDRQNMAMSYELRKAQEDGYGYEENLPLIREMNKYRDLSMRLSNNARQTDTEEKKSLKEQLNDAYLESVKRRTEGQKKIDAKEISER